MATSGLPTWQPDWAHHPRRDRSPSFPSPMPGRYLRASPLGPMATSGLPREQRVAHWQRLGASRLPDSITEFPCPTPCELPEGITAGPDGNLWFTDVSPMEIPTAGRVAWAHHADGADHRVCAPHTAEYFRRHHGRARWESLVYGMHHPGKRRRVHQQQDRAHHADRADHRVPAPKTDQHAVPHHGWTGWQPLVCGGASRYDWAHHVGNVRQRREGDSFCLIRPGY